MKNIPVRKIALRDSNAGDDLKDKRPGELLGMVWPMTLSAWSFKENLNAEPRLQKNFVVKRRIGRA